jgi:hypothetical protein
MAQSLTSIDMILSHIELRFIASLLGQDVLVGIDTNKVYDASQERIAAQSLLSRQLASLGDDGLPKIDRRVVNAVRVCAFPLRVIVAQHISEMQHMSVLSVYLTEGQCVVSRNVAEDSYRLSLFERSQDAMTEFVKFWLSDRLVSPTPNISLVVSDQVLTSVRDSALNRDIETARSNLTKSGVSPTAANALTTFLTKPHSLIALRGINVLPNQIAIRGGTIVQNGTSAWLMVENNEQSASSPRCNLSTVSSEGVRQFLQRIIAL